MTEEEMKTDEPTEYVMHSLSQSAGADVTHVSLPANTEYNMLGEEVEVRPPGRRVGVVISVLLSYDEFEMISRSAEQIGMSTSEFIKEVTLDAAKGGNSDSCHS